MWLALVAITLGAEPAKESAEAQFKKMEQTVLKSKTFETELEVLAGSDTEAFMNMKGKMIVAPGNKIRLDLEGTLRKDPEKMTMICDGKQMRMDSTKRPGKGMDATAFLSEISLASVSRAGVVASLFRGQAKPVGEKEEETPKTFDADKWFPVTDLKLGKREKVGDVEAQAIDYKIGFKGDKDVMEVTMWIDVKTNLPLKRVINVKEGERAFTITEIYAKTKLDGKIDEKMFELK